LAPLIKEGRHFGDITVTPKVTEFLLEIIGDGKEFVELESLFELRQLLRTQVFPSPQEKVTGAF
jgi:hypothetical protein